MSETAPIHTLTEALESLERLLPLHDPELYESLNPPASDSSLDALRRMMAPHALHADIEILLRWHNGQSNGRPWPLIESGILLTAQDACTHYLHMTSMCEPFQWSASWAPIAHAGWYTVAIECAQPLAGLVIDAGFPDPPRPKAFSLMHIMRRIRDMMVADVPLKAPERGPAARKWLDDRNAILQGAWPHFLQ